MDVTGKPGKMDHQTFGKGNKKPCQTQQPLFDNRTNAEWMTTKEVAVHLNTKVRHIRSLRFRREIPCRKVGGKLRFHRPTIDKWMLSKQEGE